MSNEQHCTVTVRTARISLLDDALRERYSALLDTRERARNARFRFQADRDRHLLGRALLRSALAESLAVDPAELAILPGEHGKPYLLNTTATGAAMVTGAGPGQGTEPPHFNLSHSGDWVVVALAAAPVGVDVEYIHRKNDVLALAENYFFGDELHELQSFPRPQQADRFFDYWTLKEAYMKARGEGIALGLENFGFRLRSSESIELVANDHLQESPDAWQFACVTPVPGYRLALALRSSARPVFVVEEGAPGCELQRLDWFDMQGWKEN